jgi:D-aminopeptidase
VSRPRTRDLGLRFGSLEPGPLDAITDVEGVRVGSVTLIEGDGPLRRGHGPVRTGVTVVVPREGFEPLFAGCHRLNGNGELTGLEWVLESGCLTTPIGLTNTHSVGIVRAADTMVGRDGITAHALTAERLLDAIERVKRG